MADSIDADSPAPSQDGIEVTPEMIEAGVAVLWDSCAIEHPLEADRLVVIPTRVKADSFQGFQNGASSESCPSASATGPMHDAQCGLVSDVPSAPGRLPHAGAEYRRRQGECVNKKLTRSGRFTAAWGRRARARRCHVPTGMARKPVRPG